jgi:hypothetical protein
MTANYLARLTFIGLVYIYLAKLIDTLFHGVFQPLAVASIVVCLNIIAGIVQLAFFIVIYRRHVPKNEPALKFGTILAITGSGIGILPKLLAMVALYQAPLLFFFLQHGALIGAFCPWLMAVLLFTFCLLFLSNSRVREERTLRQAFVAGTIGWGVMGIAQSLVVVNYMIEGSRGWLNGFLNYGPIVFVTFPTLTLICLSIFYLSFTTTRGQVLAHNMTDMKKD